jgi:hypothetical protein
MHTLTRAYFLKYTLILVGAATRFERREKSRRS